MGGRRQSKRARTPILSATAPQPFLSEKARGAEATKTQCRVEARGVGCALFRCSPFIALQRSALLGARRRGGASSPLPLSMSDLD